MDKIDNKVAFGVVFDDEDMASTVHGVPLKPEHARVSVDGIIQGGAQVPVPIHGEIETVEQAVGSLLSWPRDLITYAPNGPTPVEVYIFLMPLYNIDLRNLEIKGTFNHNFTFLIEKEKSKGTCKEG